MYSRTHNISIIGFKKMKTLYLQEEVLQRIKGVKNFTYSFMMVWLPKRRTCELGSPFTVKLKQKISKSEFSKQKVHIFEGETKIELINFSSFTATSSPVWILISKIHKK